MQDIVPELSLISYESYVLKGYFNPKTCFDGKPEMALSIRSSAQSILLVDTMDNQLTIVSLARERSPRVLCHNGEHELMHMHGEVCKCRIR